MNCHKARTLLTVDPAAPSPDLALHVENCSPCRSFAQSMAAVRLELRNHQATTVPDGAFSARVLERLPRQGRDQTAELLGWAAVRLLPLTLMLALLLGGWSLLSTSDPDVFLASADQDPIAWILSDETAGP